MKIQSKCPECKKTLQIEEELTGRKVKCPACKTPFVIGLDKQTPTKSPSTQLKVVLDDQSMKGGIEKKHVILGVLLIAFGALLATVAGYVLKPAHRIERANSTAIVDKHETGTGLSEQNSSQQPDIPQAEPNVLPAEPIVSATEPNVAPLESEISLLEPNNNVEVTTKMPIENKRVAEIPGKVDRVKAMKKFLVRSSAAQMAQDAGDAAAIEKKKAHDSSVRTGSMEISDLKRLKGIQDKHYRILKQLEEQNGGSNRAIERYADDEMSFALLCEIVADKTIERQVKRDVGESIEDPSDPMWFARRSSGAIVDPILLQKASDNHLVFPTSRVFYHSVRISKKVDSDEKFIAYLFNSAVVRQAVTMHCGIVFDSGASRLDNWVRLGFTLWKEYREPKNINHFSILFGNRLLQASCTSEFDGNVVAEVRLDVFREMIDKKSISIQIGSMKFELADQFIEAMRDFASRLPDGPTLDELFTIRHETDNITGRPSPPSWEELTEDSPAQGSIVPLKYKRRYALMEKVKRIASARAVLKTAIVAGDNAGISKESQIISQLQSELKELRDEPLTTRVLELCKLEVGQVGVLQASNASPLQFVKVVDEEKRISLVKYLGDDSYECVSKLIGVVASKPTRRDIVEISKKSIFVVVAGGGQEVVDGVKKRYPFDIQLVDDSIQFSMDEMNALRDAADPNHKIELTDEQEAIVKMTREEDAKRSQVRRAKSYLDNAKALLDKAQRTAAKKYLEKAIAEDPDSDTGKEAKKLLGKLP